MRPQVYGGSPRDRADRRQGGQCRGEPLALCGARENLPQARGGPVSDHQVGRHGGDARHLLRRAVASLGSRALSARSGRPDRLSVAPLLFLLHRDLAAGILLPHRPARARRAGAVPRHRARGARLVRLYLPANGLDRSDDRGRAPLAGRPQRPHAPRQGPLAVERFGGSARTHSWLPDRDRHRRRLRLLFRRRADARPAACDVRGAAGRLRLPRHLHRDHLCAGRHRPRAGLHLYVPLAAHPGRDVRPGLAAHLLSRLARRAARPAQERHRPGKAEATASTASNASPSARPASTSATARSSNASNARSASTPATRSWTRSAGRAG